MDFFKPDTKLEACRRNLLDKRSSMSYKFYESDSKNKSALQNSRGTSLDIRDKDRTEIKLR